MLYGVEVVVGYILDTATGHLSRLLLLYEKLC